MPDGLWDGEAFMALPAPAAADVEGILVRLVKQLAKAFAGEEAGWPEDALEQLQGEGILSVPKTPDAT